MGGRVIERDHNGPFRKIEDHVEIGKTREGVRLNYQIDFIAVLISRFSLGHMGHLCNVVSVLTLHTVVEMVGYAEILKISRPAISAVAVGTHRPCDCGPDLYFVSEHPISRCAKNLFVKYLMQN